MPDYSKETNDFVSLLGKTEGNIVPWTGNEAVGFSILREYPGNIPFKPAKTARGEIDSVCLLKIGYINDHNSTREDSVKLIVTASRASKYLLNNHRNYDFNDENAPTKDSLEESKKSKEPIQLDDLTGYCFIKSQNKIIDVEKDGQEVTLNYIADTIFKAHIKTIKLSGWPFRFKIGLKNNIAAAIEPFKTLSISCLKIVFGKTIQEDRGDIGGGVFKPYRHSQLYSLADEQLDLFNSGIKVSKRPGIVVALILASSAVLFSYLPAPVWLRNINDQSQITQIAFLFIFVWLIDYIFPHTILFAINLLIRFRAWLWQIRVKIR